MKRKSTYGKNKTNQLRRKLQQNVRPYIPRKVNSMETKTLSLYNQQLLCDTNSVTGLSMVHLNPVPLSPSPIARVGKKISAVAIGIKGHLRANTATTVDKVNIILVYVRSPNYTVGLPPITDILDTRKSNANSNLDNAAKFKILRRWEFCVTGNRTTPSTGKEIQTLDDYVKLKDGKFESLWNQNNTSGSISDMEKGAFVIFGVGISANGSTTTPDFQFDSRYYFNDV